MPGDIAKKLKPEGSTDSSIRRAGPSSVIIRPLPNIVYLWPTAFIAAPVSGILELLSSESSSMAPIIFFCLLTFNLLVMSFEFSRVKVITLGLAIIIAIFGLLSLHKSNPEILTGVGNIFGGMHANASAGFYFIFALIVVVLYVLVYISSRFNYWEITNNELIHHHGFLGDVDRFPAPSLRLSKEIDDVFQWMMLGTGRLILYPKSQQQAIVLDNVLRINSVENRIKELLSTLSVSLYQQREHVGE